MSERCHFTTEDEKVNLARKNKRAENHFNTNQELHFKHN